jgi:hypothetical protein
MSMFRQLARAYLINRLLRDGGHRHPTRGRYLGRPYYANARPPYGRGRRRRGRSGFFGPFPYYSKRTRSGSRVTVSGCCLPIPLGVGAFVLAAWRLAYR